MNTERQAAPIEWKLRALMAQQEMFQTTDLIAPLKAQGVQLSREQVFRLVTRTPERLNIEVFAALCRIFDCSPSDLIVVKTAAATAPVAVNQARPGGQQQIGDLRPVRARIRRPDPTSST